LLRRVYALSAFEKLRGFVRNFRIIPALKLNPVTGEIDVTFSPGADGHEALEDVLNLIDSLGSPKKRIVVVLDEFQEIFRIGEGLDRMLRSVLQSHTNVNYLFLGSAESMIRSIFETKRSPFYHFASLMTLGPLPVKEFSQYLEERFAGVAENPALMAAAILSITGAHPYYTQQLAFYVWERISTTGIAITVVEDAISEILACHDYDYERLWNSLNRTDMKVMIGLAYGGSEPLSGSFINNTGTGSTSTVYSSLKRLTSQGLLIRQGSDYLYDDPFFKRWILNRRSS
jgi:DNA-binding PadR family transcriptional regulator